MIDCISNCIKSKLQYPDGQETKVRISASRSFKKDEIPFPLLIPVSKDRSASNYAELIKESSSCQREQLFLERVHAPEDPRPNIQLIKNKYNSCQHLEVLEETKEIDEQITAKEWINDVYTFVLQNPKCNSSQFGVFLPDLGPSRCFLIPWSKALDYKYCVDPNPCIVHPENETSIELAINEAVDIALDT